MDKYLTPALIGGIVAAAALAMLAVVIWPPGLIAGILLSVLGTLLCGRSRFPRRAKEALPTGMELPSRARRGADGRGARRVAQPRADRAGATARAQGAAAREANARAAARQRSEPSAAELGALVETDRKLIALIESESQLAFDRILENRYAMGQGVDTTLILADVRRFVERVARLYRPAAESPLLETDIELIAKSLSSTALHMLVVVDGLPINLKSYNAARMHRLIRRGASYYGTYKAFRPYVERGLNALQMARLAFGVNPAAVGAAWAAGKLTSYGATWPSASRSTSRARGRRSS